jgi:hypothetical protein
MPDILPFGEYKPDLDDLDASYTASIQNVIPRADGYGPFLGFSTPFAAALPGPCCGGFYARKQDGSVAVFGATATDLYMLNNTTLAWTKVTNTGGAYTAVSANALWQFEQFNNFVIAVQANAVPQYFDLRSFTNFENLPGSPPAAAYISIVNSFVLLSGLASYPYRIQWSALNDPTSWTAGVNSSDYQDFADGGTVRGTCGGEMGFVFQDTAIRLMVFAPGSDVIFQIERIAKDVGLFYPYSLVMGGDNIYFLSAKGFQMFAGGVLTPIGRERVDRTLSAAIDAGNPQYVIGAHDPNSGRIYWVYKSAVGSTAGFDSGLVYDPVLDRWSPFSIQGQYVLSLAQPGITLEGLDAIAPGAVAVTGAANNGSGLVRLTVASTASYTTSELYEISGVGGVTGAAGQFKFTIVDSTHVDLIGSTFGGSYTSGGIIGGSIDAMTTSLDSIAGSPVPQLGAFDLTNAFNFFTGPALQATLQTSEQSAIKQRMFIQGFYPVTDAPAALGNIAVRENLNATPTLTPQQPMNVRGFIPARADARHARGTVVIQAGTVWTYARGITPLMVQRGKR